MSKALAVCHGEFGRVTVYLLNRNLATHVHREGHLIFYIKGARPTVKVNEEHVPVGPGQAAAINPWEPHAFNTCPSGDDSYFLTIYVDPAWFKRVSVDWDGAFQFGRPTIHVDLDILREINSITNMLLASSSEGSSVDEQQISAELHSLMRRCFEQSWKGRNAQSPRTDLPTDLQCSDPRVKKALALMRQESANDISLDTVARNAGLSRPHFFKLFKEQTGITPNLYLNTLRMEKAIGYLTDSELSVTEIAYDLGFASQASFTRFFCMNVGIPPSDYRRVAALDESSLH